MIKDLKMFVLNSGQEVIAELITEIDVDAPNSFIVKHALVVQVVPQGPEQYGIALIPLSPTNPEAKMRIFNHSLAGEHIDEIPKGLADAYFRRTTGLEIVSALPGQL